jgi:hypothetical protein
MFSTAPYFGSYGKLKFSVCAYTAFSGIRLILIYELGAFDSVQILIL